MADKWRTVSSLQKNEELAETIPCRLLCLQVVTQRLSLRRLHALHNVEIFHEPRNDFFLLAFFCFYYRIKLHSIELFLLQMNPFFQKNDKFLALIISSVNVHTCFRSFQRQLTLASYRQLSLVSTKWEPCLSIITLSVSLKRN